MTEADTSPPTPRGGRHRAPKPSHRPTARVLPLLAVLLVIGLVAVGGYAYIASDDDAPSATTTSSTTTEHEGSVTVERSVVESTRDTSVKDNVVTVREVVSLLEGPEISVGPQNARPAAGLEWKSSSLANEDGTTPTFDQAVTVQNGRSVTVVGTYRLTNCPDVLPVWWPTPARIYGSSWDRTFTRLRVPQFTARAMCPKARSKATELPGLSGKMVKAKNPTVRLRWQGQGKLTVNLVGSATQVAVDVKTSSCRHECVAVIPHNGARSVEFRPLDLCAIGGHENLLTLRASKGQGGTRTIAVTVPQLATKVCTSARR